ncbi:methyltransferase domain-containing protein [Kitasatospora sp. NPDC090091]|uniref:methyltransferase domain-containing protein n=1 Tax=Kitasatospora sp. NPDC090091 TaxID=3364081 RepID=UPI0037FA7A5B
MSEADEAVHEHLVDCARLTAHGCVADLGCGRGPTLAAFARRFPGARLVGLDHSPAGVDAARELLAGHPGGADLRVADLAQPLPLAAGCADAVVSYNVLECLADPAALLREVSRVLRPGGRAVLAHVDFDSLMIVGAPRGLDRRICHAFTDDQQPPFSPSRWTSRSRPPTRSPTRQRPSSAIRTSGRRPPRRAAGRHVPARPAAAEAAAARRISGRWCTCTRRSRSCRRRA